MLFDREHEVFSARQRDEVVAVYFKENLLQQLTDLNKKEVLFEFLHKVSDSRDVKVVVIFGSQKKIKRVEAIEFFRELLRPGVDVKKISRIYNALNQLILIVRRMPKMVIHADSGEVISMFMNLSLACDYRIIAERTVFHYPTIELGLVPKGGGIFFLSDKLGESKTIELLFSGEDIDAKKALELGIVNKIVPSGLLETEAIKAAQHFSRKPLRLISGFKRLMNLFSKDLQIFLDLENQVLLEAIGSERFQNRLDNQVSSVDAKKRCE